MNIKNIRIMAPFILALFIFTACAPLPPPGTPLTPEQRASAQRQCIATYTVVGTLGGAALGALFGKGEGALIGAAAGGALAFAIAWGHCLSAYSDLKSYPVAGAQETAERTGYNPSQGNVIKIEDYSLDPTGVAPGGKVRMNGAYYVLAPDGQRDIKVVETRSLSFLDPEKNEWKELGAVDQEVMAAIGTRRAEGNFDIPPDAPEGQYRIALKVAANGKYDQLSRDLTVKKGMPSAPSDIASYDATGAKSISGSSAGGKIIKRKK